MGNEDMEVLINVRKPISLLEKILKPGVLRDLLGWEPCIDNLLFRLHYKLSFTLIFLTSFVYWKVNASYDVISCIFTPGGDQGTEHQKAVDGACFASSVYSVTLAHDDIYMNTSLPPYLNNPGVMGFEDLALLDKQNVRYHKYYQYTPFIMLVQMLLFLTPWYLWRCWEDGKMAMLVKGLDPPVMDMPFFTEKKKHIAEYFVACLGYNNPYAGGYLACELFNLLGVLFQLYFLDAVTGQALSSHGFNVYKYVVQQEKKDDPFNIGFPTVGKCTFNRHGPSGNIIPHSGICTLPLNLVTRGYFVLIWFLLLCLGIANMVNLTYRLVTVWSLALRLQVLKGLAPTTPHKMLQLIVKKGLYGDWFILQLMAQNVDSPIFNDILQEIALAMQQTQV